MGRHNSSTAELTHLLEPKKKLPNPCSLLNVTGVLMSFGLIGGAIYVQSNFIQGVIDASNALCKLSNGMWGQMGNITQIFNKTGNGSCVVVKDLPCNYTANTDCSVFDPIMLNCNSGYGENLTAVLKNQNPAPCTTPLDTRVQKYFPQLLSSFISTCDQATYTRWKDLSMPSLGMVISGAALLLGSLFKCRNDFDHRNQLLLQSGEETPANHHQASPTSP